MPPSSWAAGQNLLLALNYVHPGESRLACEAHEEWGRRFQERHPPLPPLTAADVDTTPGRPLVVSCTERGQMAWLAWLAGWLAWLAGWLAWLAPWCGWLAWLAGWRRASPSTAYLQQANPPSAPTSRYLLLPTLLIPASPPPLLSSLPVPSTGGLRLS